MVPSDHCPCLVSVSTVIPRSRIFIFENYWMKYTGFQEILANSWNQNTNSSESAKVITAKFKLLRKFKRLAGLYNKPKDFNKKCQNNYTFLGSIRRLQRLKLD